MKLTSIWLVFLTVLLLCSYPSADEELMRRHEPFLFFHKDDVNKELFYPMDVEAYLSRCSLWLGQTLGDRKEYGEEAISPKLLANLGRTKADSDMLYLKLVEKYSPLDLIPLQPKDYYWDYTTDALLEYLNASPKYTYYYRQFIEPDYGYLVLQYWFLYAFNSWGAYSFGYNLHEGDWESITLFLHPVTQSPIYAAFSAHHDKGEKVRNTWGEIKKTGTHPNVFVALGSHANYFEPKFDILTEVLTGELPESAGGPFFDRANSLGMMLGSLKLEGASDWEEWENRVILEDEAHSLSDWARFYDGKWGMDAITDKTGFDGPRFPPFQSDNDKWYHPAKWAGIMEGPSTVELPVPDTPVIGFIEHDTTWTQAESPYVSVGRVVVQEGAILTIEPGVTVKFDSGHGLAIAGTLIARGTADDMIIFTSKENKVRGAWEGIAFETPSASASFDGDRNYIDGSVLQYCVVEYARTGIEGNSASPFIERCTIANSSSGITISGANTVLVKDSLIADNSNTGLYIDTIDAVIFGNIVAHNGDGGISVNATGLVIIDENTLRENVSESEKDFFGDYIYYASSGGMDISGETVKILNNTIEANKAMGHSAWGGGGVIRGANIEIRGNIISGNLAESQRFRSADSGGLDIQGNYAADSVITVDNNTFIDNRAVGGAAGWWVGDGGDARGGAMSIGGDIISITGNIFTRNSAQGRGGGLSYGGGIFIGSGSINVSDNTFIQNTESIYSYGPMTLSNNTFDTNGTSVRIRDSGNSLIIGNKFTGDDRSVLLYQGDTPAVMGNEIIGSREALNYNGNGWIVGNYVTGSQDNAIRITGSPVVNRNAIFDNKGLYNLYYSEWVGSPDLDATYNYWGVTTEAEIRGKIYDFFQNENTAVVRVYPFLTENSFAEWENIPVPTHIYDFGIMPIGHYAEMEFEISNVEDRILTLYSVVSDNPAFTIASPNFPQTVSPNSSLRITMKFSPAEEKPYMGIINLVEELPDTSEKYILVRGTGEILSVASFSYSPSLDEFLSGQEMSFIADESEKIVSYQWDFGDGKSDTGPIVRHRYQGAPDQAITYTVSLTIEDGNGYTNDSEANITVVPIEKTVEIVHRTLGEPTTIGARIGYSWMGTDQGKNVYKISKIDDWSSYFVGYYDVSVESKDRTLWSKRIIATPVRGEPYTPEQLLIADDEDWLSVKAYGVTEAELLSIISTMLAGTGVPTGPVASPLFVESAKTYLAPNYVDTSGFPAIDEKDMEIAPLTIAHIGSPVELRIYDSDGRVTGLVNGEVKEEIPDSVYYKDTAIVLSEGISYRYELEGIEEGKYDLGILSVVDEKPNSIITDDIPISPKEVHQYTIDWDILSQGEEGVTVKIEEDGDLVPERTITSDSELTEDEYLFAIAVNPKGKYFTSWADVKQTKLFQNYPNPFNPETWIPYVLAEECQVKVIIYSVTGKLIRTLDLGKKQSGIYLSKKKALYWDGCDNTGQPVASGVYFYTIQAGDFTATKKMSLAH